MLSTYSDNGNDDETEHVRDECYDDGMWLVASDMTDSMLPNT